MENVEETVNTEEIQEDGSDPKVTEPENQEKKEEGETPAKPESKPEEPDWYVKKIGKLTKEKYVYKEKYLAVKAKNQNVAQKPVAPNPVEYTDQYGNVKTVEWNLAMETWHNEMVNYNNYQVKTKQEEEESKKEVEENKYRFQMQSAELTQKYPDFPQVVAKEVYSPKLIEALYEQENSGELTYYLGKNETEALRIGRLPLDQMIEELDAISDKIKSKGKTVSMAPPPITPVDDSKHVVSEDLSQISDDDEWLKKRQENKKKQFQGK
jgi:hypothetical protein